MSLFLLDLKKLAIFSKNYIIKLMIYDTPLAPLKRGIKNKIKT